MSIAQEMLQKAGYKSGESTDTQAATTAGAADPAATNGNPDPATQTTAATTQKADGAGAQGAAADNPGDATPPADALDPANDGKVTVRDVAPAQAATTDPATTAAATTDQVDEAAEEAKVMAILSKKAGRQITSLDEFLKPAAASAPAPTEDEKKAMLDKFQNDAIKFGLDKQLFDTKTLEAYNVDKAKDTRDLAMRVFADELMAGDAELTQLMKDDRQAALETINERFQDFYGEHEEEGSWKRNRGQALMQQVANGYINHKYGSVLTATDALEAELTTQQNAVGYKAKVEKVFSDMPAQLEVVIDGKAFSYQIPEVTRKSIKEQFLSTDTFNRLGEGQIEEAALRSTVDMAIWKLEQNKFIAEVAKSYAASEIKQIQMGRKNIPVFNESTGTSQNGAVAPVVSKAREMLERQAASA